MWVAILVLLTGCEVFRCEEGEQRCSGDGIATCNAYGRWEISLCCAQDGCREVEVDGAPAAVCSPQSTPDPRCDGTQAIDSVCVDGPASLHCDSGYGGFEHACEVTCVTPEPGIAFCALADQPDPRCDLVGGSGRLCLGDRILRCARGFAIAEEPCVTPYSECTLVPDNLGHLSPRCATPILVDECVVDSPGRCDGRDIIGCRGGRRTAAHCEHSCYENPIDSMFPEAFCEGPPCDYD